MAADGRCGYDSCQDSRDACCEIDNLRAHEHGVTKKGSSGELSSSEVQVCFSSGLGVFMRVTTLCGVLRRLCLVENRDLLCSFLLGRLLCC